jgi:hypothetical protein
MGLDHCRSRHQGHRAHHCRRQIMTWQAVAAFFAALVKAPEPYVPEFAAFAGRAEMATGR